MTQVDQTIQTMGYKTCKMCGKIKPYSEFYRSTHNADGYHSYCKECFSHYGSAEERRKRKEAKGTSSPDAISSTPASTPVPKPDTVKAMDTNVLVDELRGRGKTVLIDPTPRELMEQLVNRGYVGTLEYYEKKTISLASFKSA